MHFFFFPFSREDFFYQYCFRNFIVHAVIFNIYWCLINQPFLIKIISADLFLMLSWVNLLEK